MDYVILCQHVKASKKFTINNKKLRDSSFLMYLDSKNFLRKDNVTKNFLYIGFDGIKYPHFLKILSKNSYSSNI